MTLAASEVDLLRREHLLPGLALLLDADAFAERLAAVLPDARLRAAHCTYLRYKGGTNCLAGYRLDLGESSLAAYARAYRVDDGEKMRKALERAPVPSTLGPGKFLLPDALVVVVLYPNDNEVRSLHRLADEDHRRSLLSKVVPERQELLGATLSCLAWKPERRFVGHLDAEGSGAVLRLYSRSAVARRSRAGRQLISGRELRLARVWGESERHRLTILEWLPGRLLAAQLADPAWQVSELARVGSGLAELHRARPAVFAAAGPSSARRLAAAAEAVARLGPALASRARALAGNAAVELARGIEGHCLVHGDFYAKQVLLQEQSVAFIDLDAASWGEPASDLGNFLGHLERDAASGRISAGIVGPAREALLAGYRAAGGQVGERRLALHTATALLRLAPHPFRSREPGWRERIDGLLSRAEANLAAATSGRRVWEALP